MRFRAFALFLGFLLDLAMGDPDAFFHPVAIIRKLISVTEGFVRRRMPKNKQGAFLGGAVTAIFICAVTFFVPFLAMRGLYRKIPVFAFILEAFLCGRLISPQSVRINSMKVYNRLENGTLPQAQRALSAINGRDASHLNEVGVTKSTVEYIALGTTSGAIAPMFYMALGGLPLLALCKAIENLNDCLGFKNERYLYFGQVSRRLWDMAAFVPSRIAGLLIVAGSYFFRMDSENAMAIYRRDRNKTSRINNGQTQAPMAGALCIQLGGDSSYYGRIIRRPALGDPLRPVEEDDIPRANDIMSAASFLGLLIFMALSRLVAFIVTGR